MLLMVLFGMSIIVVLWDVLDLVRFLKAYSAEERVYIRPKTALRLEEAQPVSSAFIASEAVCSASVSGDFAPVATVTHFICANVHQWECRPQETMLRFAGGSAVDLAYKFRDTNRGGVTLESRLRACQSPI